MKEAEECRACRAVPLDAVVLRGAGGVALAGGEARGRRAGDRGDAGARRCGRPGALIAAAGGRTLTEREAKEVLALYGVPVVGERVAQSVDEAVNAAGSLGYPVVLKVESPDLPHKTEAGVVRLNLRNADEVRDGVSDDHGDAPMRSRRRRASPACWCRR